MKGARRSSKIGSMVRSELEQLVRETFGDILKRHGGAGPGFDLLRLALAIAILLSHLAVIGDTRGIFAEIADLFLRLIGHAPMLPHEAVQVAAPVHQHPPAIPDMGLSRMGLTRPIVLTHVPMFFALSGFLVAGSAFRTKRVLPFLGLRFLRIFPALCVEVVLSAILIGTAFTTLPFNEYFSSRGFWTYFGNIGGFVQMWLPGVYFHDGSDAVNGNLWTLPAEFHSYLILSFLLIAGVVFNRTIFSLAFVLVTVGLLTANFAYGYNATSGLLAGDVNVYYFFVGVMFFLWRERIPHSSWLFIPCVVATYFLMRWQHGVYITPLLLTYATVFIGLINFPRFRLVQSGDYSYGIYLYGFPISQMLATTFPAALRNNFFGLMCSALVCTLLFAFLSWHLIEKRFLKLRKYFSIQSAKIAENLHPDALAVTRPVLPLQASQVTPAAITVAPRLPGTRSTPRDHKCNVVNEATHEFNS
jgi:peptidoglycan/LPS O-acetylase OafA/YrhL